MTVRVSKPKFDLRSKLSELDYGHLPHQKVSPGSIVQVVHRSTSNQSSTTSSSWSATDVYASIHPHFADSKILIMMSGGMTGNSGGSEHSYTVGAFTIYKGIGGVNYETTDSISQGQMRYHLDAHKYVPLSINFLDDFAGTREEIVYKLYFKRTGGSSTVNTNRDANNKSQTILMEVKQ